MTKLEMAFAEAAKLPFSDQDALGHLILQGLASGRRWADAFERAQDALEQLADEALWEHRSRQTQSFDLIHL